MGTLKARLVTAVAVLVGALSLGAAAPAATGSATGPLQWSRPATVDRFPPAFGGYGVRGVTCPSPTLCVAVAGDDVVTSSNPTGGPRTWHHARVGSYPLEMISCPSVNMCVASDGFNLYASADPAGGARAWHMVEVNDRGQISSLSCPVVHLCVAVDLHGNVLDSSHPTGGIRAWHKHHALSSKAFFFTKVSCPSARFCAAVASDSRVFTTTDPQGSGAWAARRIEKGGKLGSVSCPLRHLCVAGDSRGYLLTATAPRSGPWSRIRLARGFVDNVWCWATRICVAVAGHFIDLGEGERGQYPYLFATSAPTGGRQAWHRSTPDAGASEVSCPALDLCVAAVGGQAWTTSDPVGGEWAGRSELAGGIDGASDMTGISCPTTGFCAAVDWAGNVLTTSSPTSSPRGWHPQGLDSSALMSGISCPTSGLCVAVDTSGGVLASSDPRGGQGAWSFDEIDHENGGPGYIGSLRSIACPSITMCVAVDDLGYAFTSTNPTGGAGAWNVSDIDPNAPGSGTLPNALNEVACPASNLCVAGDNSGDVLSSLNPTGGAGAWNSVNIEHPQNRGGIGIVHVSCPSTNLCVVVDGDGEIFTSTDPTGPASAWTKQVPANYLGGPQLGFTCASTHLCVGFGYDAPTHMYYSSDPIGGASAWHETGAPRGLLRAAVAAVSCPSASPPLCLAVSGPEVTLARSAPPTGS